MLTGDLLKGIRVLDLTQNVAGPYCSQILGDLGAEIIKVERPGSGDDTRHWPPHLGDGSSSTFLAFNRNKRSIGIDIDTVAGQKIVRDLARDAQIFIHSLKPGSAERRGLGQYDLETINPGLIYCAISAFGQSGPLASSPGYDPLLQAFTGIMSVTGDEGQEPVRAGVSLIDMGTGLWSAFGIMAALLRKKESGKGGLVEASLLETGVSWMTVFAASYQASGALPRRMGSATALAAPYELFRAKDGHLFVAAGNDRLFAAVCAGLGCTTLAEDARFSSNARRVENREGLHQIIESLTSQRSAGELVDALRAAGAPCSEMNDVADMLSHEQVKASGIVTPLPLEAAADHKVVGLPFLLDGARGVEPRAPPRLGEDTDAVLGNLGYSAAAIAELRSTGAIG